MKRILLVVVMSMALSACSDERLYQILGSPPPQGPPTIYPMNFPVCQHKWGTVVVPLGIIFYRDTFPNPEYAMQLRKKHPDKSVCDIILKRSTLTSHGIRSKDYWESVVGLDKSGKGYFAASTYEFNLISDESRREIERKRRNNEEAQQRKLVRDGYAKKDL